MWRDCEGLYKSECVVRALNEHFCLSENLTPDCRSLCWNVLLSNCCTIYLNSSVGGDLCALAVVPNLCVCKHQTCHVCIFHFFTKPKNCCCKCLLYRCSFGFAVLFFILNFWIKKTPLSSHFSCSDTVLQYHSSNKAGEPLLQGVSTSKDSHICSR